MKKLIIVFVIFLSYLNASFKTLFCANNLNKFISVSFYEADMAEILTTLSELTGYNIIYDGSIKDKITATFRNVSLKDILAILLKQREYELKEEENIIYIKASETFSKTFYLKYADAEQMAKSLEKLKSEKGQILSDTRINAIWVMDYKKNLEIMEKFIKDIDLEGQQIEIDARIIEISFNENEKKGFNWTLLDLDLGSVEGNVVADLTERKNLNNSSGSGNLQIQVVNKSIDLILQTLSLQAKINVLSSPKITTMNRKKAIIKVVEKIPFIKATTGIQTNTGTSTTNEVVEFEDVGISFEVTPTLTKDYIILEINPRVSEVIQYFKNIPVVANREINSTVNAEDGQTIIIGGLIKDSESLVTKKVPLLNEIPFLGKIFNEKEKIKRRTELIVLISPRIVKRKNEVANAFENDIKQKNNKLNSQTLFNKNKEFLEKAGVFVGKDGLILSSPIFYEISK